MKNINPTLRFKLQFIIASFSVLVLAIGFLLLSFSAHQNFHKSLKNNLQILAQVLADNSRAAVTFNDQKTALTILEAAKGNPQIEFAAIIKDSEWFATYSITKNAPDPSTFQRVSGVWKQDDQYYAAVPIQNAGQQLGMLVLQSNTQAWGQVVSNLLTILLVLFITLLIVALLVSYILNKHITQPLQDLVIWASNVAKHKDFNVRAEKKHNDEVGYLVDSLNAMLTELAKRESIVTWNKILEEEIQERKLIEKDLIEMRNNADAANKAKSQFLANMSHELRTPLNAIIGYSEMVHEVLQDGEIDIQELASDISKIRGAGKHLLTLINDILDLSKIEAGKMDLNIETIDTNILIKDVINTIQPLADAHKNALNIRIESSLGELRSDIVKVRQILFNLLSNAAKFTENGQITLRCFRNIGQDSDHLVFVVNDTGIGISQDSLKSLFKPFTQADTSTTRKFGGTGLGLVISNSYAQMLGGDIKVESEVGVGSTFTISLPQDLSREPRPASTEIKTLAKTPHQTDGDDLRSSTRVLLIDDDESVHTILRYQLSHHGFEITSAYSGAEGLRMTTSNRFDVIVLDIMMPEMDGWEALQLLKANPTSQDIPVVLYTIVTDAEKGYALGATEYLVKPIGKQQIISTLKKYSRPLPPHKVLLIDDDQNAHDLMKKHLASTQINVLSAFNGKDGLAIAQSETDIELILLDLIMPGMNGFEFIEKFNHLDQDIKIPIVVISARELSSTERDLLLNHASMVITKGQYSKDDLITTILHMLNTHTSTATHEKREA